MGFATALSGLSAAATNLQVIGNNIANANTTGFKESRAEFADVYNSVSKVTPGAGVRVSEVAQQFSQGNLDTTQNTLDLALSGNGFFALAERTDSTSTTAYTRNGAFHLNPEGFITNDTGHFLMGGSPIGTKISDGFNTGAPSALRIDTSQGAPSATAKVDLQVNLDSRQGLPEKTFVGYDFNTSSGPDIDTYNSSTTATIFDSLGNTHTLTSYFVDETASGASESTWGAYLYLDGRGINTGTAATLDAPDATVSTAITTAAGGAADATAALTAVSAVPNITAQQIAAATAAAALTGATNTSVGAAAATAETVGTKIPMIFDSLGNLIADTTGTDISGTNGIDDIVFSNIDIAPVVALGVSAEPLSLTINPTGSTQYATDFGVNDIQQDGFSSGNLTGVTVDSEGVVLARYSNGTSSPLGQVILGRFTNNQGLAKLGDTVWQESLDSGTVTLGVAGGNNFGDIQSSALENSNTDIATQLVKLIVAQQAYQANAQTISTEDEIIQRILQL